MKYVFIDVDGVLNAFSPSSSSDYFRTSGKSGNGVFPLWLNKDHAQWLTELALSTGAKLVWATTWQHDANTQIGPKIGLPYLPVVEIQPYTRYRTVGDTKSEAVSHWWIGADGGKSVWFDDELDCADGLSGTSVRHIWVEPYGGLTEEHIRQAAEYLSGS